MKTQKELINKIYDWENEDKWYFLYSKIIDITIFYLIDEEWWTEITNLINAGYRQQIETITEDLYKNRKIYEYAYDKVKQLV